MTFVFFLFIIGFILFIIFVVRLFLNDKKFSVLELALLFFSIFFILTGYLLQNSLGVLEKFADGNYDKIGPYGDYLGGMLNPLVAVFAVLAAGLAFYAQYQANKQVQEQFKLQKFESQFYEMLHLHRENLNEMVIEGYEYDYLEGDKTKKGVNNSKRSKITSGKKIFVTMLNEFEALHFICKKCFFMYYKADSEKLIDLQKTKGKQLIFDHAYYVFFNGIRNYSENIEKYVLNDKTCLLDNTLLKYYKKQIERIKDKHQEGIKVIERYSQIKGLNYKISESSRLYLSFNYKPFSGHQSILAHYYRHLFQTVKFVTQQQEEVLSYKSKRDYLRILRSMLSNHEQILLYYNWIGGFGSKWEKKIDTTDTSNKFFTDYRMIHNIPNQMVMEEFKLDKVFVGEYLNFRFEKGRKASDDLFELTPIKSKLQ